MTTLHLTLPEPLSTFVDSRVASGTYGSSSGYLRELIRQDQSRQQLRDLIEDGLRSPVIGPADAAYWQAKRQKLEQLR